MKLVVLTALKLNIHKRCLLRKENQGLCQAETGDRSVDTRFGKDTFHSKMA